MLLRPNVSDAAPPKYKTTRFFRVVFYFDACDRNRTRGTRGAGRVSARMRAAAEADSGLQARRPGDSRRLHQNAKPPGFFGWFFILLHSTAIEPAGRGAQAGFRHACVPLPLRILASRPEDREIPAAATKIQNHPVFSGGFVFCCIRRESNPRGTPCF